MFFFKVYDKLRRTNPDFSSKIHIVKGDVLEKNLGISDEDKKFLEDNINIVFHSAATIRFEEPLRVAVRMNVIATKEIVLLCKKMRNLEVV